MLFNFGKCKCIHIGHGNMDEEYKMEDAVLYIYIYILLYYYMYIYIYIYILKTV